MKMACLGQSSFMKLFREATDSEKRRRYRRKDRVSTDEKPMNFGIAKTKLEQKLNFCHIPTAPNSPFNRHKEGEILSKRLVTFLRHGLGTSGLSHTDDGAVLVQDVIRLWKEEGFVCTEAMVAEACKPMYGNGKTRLLMGEVIGRGHFICALGGHSFEVQQEFGSYSMTLFEGEQIKNAFHATRSLCLIKREGYISRMERTGVHFFFHLSNKERHPYARNSNLISVDIVAAMKAGITFRLNRFSGIIFGMGRICPESGKFDGKIPLEFCSW